MFLKYLLLIRKCFLMYLMLLFIAGQIFWVQNSLYMTPSLHTPLQTFRLQAAQAADSIPRKSLRKFQLEATA